MKIIAVSKNGAMWKLGTGEEDAKWHWLENNVRSFAKTFKVGEEVTVKVEQKSGKYWVSYINRGDKPAGTGAGASKPSGGAKYSGDERRSIERQVILKTVGQALIGLQGQITPDNIEEVSTKLFLHFEFLLEGEPK